MAGMVNIATPSYEDYVLSLSPIAYWPFNETSGTVVNDLSESGYHGNIVNGITGITYSGDILRNGSSGSMGFGINAPTISHASFNHEYVKISEFMGQGESGTICGYFKKVAQTSQNRLFSKWTSAYSGTFRYGAWNDTFESPRTRNTITLSPYGLYEIQFFAWVKEYSINRYKLYQNGEWLYSTKDWVDEPKIGDGPFEIPGASGWNYYPIRGYISDIAMFDYALSDEEIEQMYSLGKIE